MVRIDEYDIIIIASPSIWRTASDIDATPLAWT